MRMVIAAAAASLAASSAGALEVSSPDIAANGKIADKFIFNSFGCSGGNLSPAIKWSGAPAGTKSFALQIYDPDAPTGSGFWHWVMVDIPPDVMELPEGAGDPKGGKTPAGATLSRTDFGVPGYGGPCPPQGDAPHHYHFILSAVDAAKLGADSNTTPAVVGFMLHFHTLAKAEFVATYGR